MLKKYLRMLENNLFSLGQTQPIRCNLTNRKLSQSHSPPTSCRACIFLPHETHQMSHDFSPDADRQRIQMIAYHRPELLRHSVTNEKGSATYDFEKSRHLLLFCPGRVANLGSFGSCLFYLTSSTLDHSATAPPRALFVC